MIEKIRIRRRPDGWHVTRPAFGFASATTTVYPTGKAALASLTAYGMGSASSAADRRSEADIGLFAARGGRFLRPRRIEAGS